MKELKNIRHGFDTRIHEVGVTIRKGPKWCTPIGTLVRLKECLHAHHDGKCINTCLNHGTGITLGSWYGQMKDLPGDLLQLEHNILRSSISGSSC